MALDDMQLSPQGAAEDQLAELERALGAPLPKDLRAFLAQHDGGRGTVGARKRPLVLWSAEQIGRAAQTEEVSLATPGLLLFGTDGGAEGYGHLPRLARGRYGRISLLAAGAHEFEGLADGFDELLRALGEDR